MRSIKVTDILLLCSCSAFTMDLTIWEDSLVFAMQPFAFCKTHVLLFKHFMFVCDMLIISLEIPIDLNNGNCFITNAKSAVWQDTETYQNLVVITQPSSRRPQGRWVMRFSRAANVNLVHHVQFQQLHVLNPQ